MPTIAESFDISLPDQAARSEDPYPEAHVSGPSTQSAEPPTFSYKISFRDGWGAYAARLLRHVNLSRPRLASWEGSRALLNEADVSDAASPQLLNPVDLALCARHPGVIRSFNQYPVGTARADRCWFQENQGVPTLFAVLDYKRPGVIRREEFEAAVVQDVQSDPRLALLEPEDSLFTGNSRILLQQAVNYANQYQTQFVAFFDWETLLLLVLPCQEGALGGDWCYASIIRNDGGQIRRGLLGFLERAYATSKGSSLDPLPISNGTSGRRTRDRRQ